MMSDEFNRSAGGYTSDSMGQLGWHNIGDQQRAGVNAYDSPAIARDKVHYQKMNDIRANRIYTGPYEPAEPSLIAKSITGIFQFCFYKLPRYHLIKFILIALCLFGLYMLNNSDTQRWARQGQWELLPKDFKFEKAEFWHLSDKDKLSFFRKMSNKELHQFYVGNYRFNKFENMQYFEQIEYLKSVKSQYNKLKDNEKIAFIQVLKERVIEHASESKAKSTLNERDLKVFTQNSCALINEVFYDSSRFPKANNPHIAAVAAREGGAMHFDKNCKIFPNPAEWFLTSIYFHREDPINARYYKEVNGSIVMLWDRYRSDINFLLSLMIAVLTLWASLTMPKTDQKGAKKE